MRHPYLLMALVAASAIVIGGLSVTRASMIESEARAELTSEFDHVVADLALVDDRAVAARTVEETAQECVDAEAARIGPVLAASARFSTSTVALAGATVGRSTTAQAAEPAVVLNARMLSVTPVLPAPGADIEQLRTALAQARAVRADAGAAAHDAELAAAERHVACDAARRAVAEAVAEVGPRTDAVISASGLASAESVAELRGARDAVLATEGEATGADALPRWIAAASVVESTHATANAAAIAAAEQAAARFASPTTGSAPRAGSSGPAYLFHPEWRVLTPEEVAALGMPPGSIIQEVPPGYYTPTGPTVD
ncbi:hypothetical protein [Agromyces sp. NPDC057865]|uniref:hypothetical protein n=1 Tax=Agromyces sp. NPDC057865 TaxID=3346267 RepID=UPI00366B45E4